MYISKNIFRDYDIRGRVDLPNELSDENVFLIHQAYGSFLRENAVSKALLAYDDRPTSLRFRDLVTKALNSTGIDVLDIGDVPIPIFYFLNIRLGLKGGVMITGSHNSEEWNGFKHSFLDRLYLKQEEIQSIYKLTINRSFINGVGGYVLYKKASSDYINDLIKKVRIKKSLKVFIYNHNSQASKIAIDIFRRLNIGVCFSKKSRTKIVNAADINILNKLAYLTKKYKADAGFVYDSDGDRFGVVDGNGKIIWQDRILFLFAKNVLKNHPGSPVIFDVKSSYFLREEIEKLGGRAIMYKTGRTFIAEKMKELNSLLAGERSGHIFIKDNYYGYDDGIFASLKLLEIISDAHESLSSLILQLPQYISSPVYYLYCQDYEENYLMQDIKKHIHSDLNSKNIEEIDGIRVEFFDGWFLFRPSHTESAIELVFEGYSKKKYKKIEKLIKEFLNFCPKLLFKLKQSLEKFPMV